MKGSAALILTDEGRAVLLLRGALPAVSSFAFCLFTFAFYYFVIVISRVVVL